MKELKLGFDVLLDEMYEVFLRDVNGSGAQGGGEG